MSTNPSTAATFSHAKWSNMNFEQVGKDRNGPPSWLTEYWSKYSVGKGQPGKGSNVDLAGKGSLGDLVGNSEGTVSRQNYWAPSFGNWPTHTVSKYLICTSFSTSKFVSNSDPSNINILQEPKIPIGKLCPENWKYFQGSCYLLRNQVK